MKLEEVFEYTDPDGITWSVPSDFVVDGASIPKALWALVGSPYTGDYRRASIVHDKACNDAVGNRDLRRAADRMFFSACLAGGCSVDEATTLYLGVRFGAYAESIPLLRPGIEESYSPRARTSMSPGERKIESDFRVAREIIASQSPTEDPYELEKRADAAFRQLAER